MGRVREGEREHALEGLPGFAHGLDVSELDDRLAGEVAELLAGLTCLLTTLPPTEQTILTKRHDVRLDLRQLRLVGELAEIRAAGPRHAVCQ